MTEPEAELKRLGYTNQFKRDLRRVLNRGYDYGKLDAVIMLLRQGEKLPLNYKNHPLTGNWAGHHECHLAPNWLLIYKVLPDAILLVSTGTHSDLF